MQIRPEESADQSAVYALNTAAFETTAEANLVDALREQAEPVISLVADDAGEIVGHILFSPVELSSHPDATILGLAPMAVHPERQSQGIGSALVRAGLGACRELAVDAVVVLGHPEYYPRFGFNPSHRFGFGCEYDVPAEVFLALELSHDCLSGASGNVEFHPAFGDL